MESRDLFERPSRAVRPRKPIAVITAASVLLPGTGHLLLGSGRTAAWLLGLVVLCPPLALALRGALPEDFAPLAWLVGRVGVWSALFAVLDAPLRAREPRWAARRSFQVPPRSAAFLNLVGFGLGHWRMDEKPAAGVAFVAGAIAHVGLLLWLPDAFVFLAEIVPLALALWGWRLAVAIGRRRDDEVRPAALLPSWLVPAQAVVATLIVAGGLFAWIVHGHWLEARAVDASRAVAMEPYYRNPAYGLDLEMRAPGWSFRDPAPDCFVEARHAAERCRLRVTLSPRLPGRDGDGVVRSRVHEVLARDGLVPVETALTTVDVGGTPVHRAHGVARDVDGDEREFVAVSYPHGFRRYLLQMDWSPAHAEFGAAEWDFVLNGLNIEGVAFGTVMTGK
jgi:hypothetical protein